MTFPAENQAHLDPEFPRWLSLCGDLIAMGQKDDRCVMLESDVSAEKLIQLLRESTPLYADLATDPVGQNLLIVYQPLEAREHDRYLQLASRRFMLEVSLDKCEALLSLRLVFFDSEADGLVYSLKTMTDDRAGLLEFLSNTGPIQQVELD